MARKHKVGIDYFSHDVDMLQDRKVKFIKAKHGLIGYAIYLRLLEELYRDQGYFLKIDEEFKVLFCDDNSINLEKFESILVDCVDQNLFNKNKFESYKILTSKRIQLNYLEATKRRSRVEFIEPYLLITVKKVKENYGEKINVDINRVNVDINPENDDINSQRKVNKSKGNKKESNKRPSYATDLDGNLWTEDRPEYKIAERLAEVVKQNCEYAKIPSDIRKWIKPIDRLIRLDEVDPKEIYRVIDKFLLGHDFWSSNILSAKKLRDKFPTLYGQYKREIKKGNKFKSKEEYQEEIKNTYGTFLGG